MVSCGLHALNCGGNWNNGVHDGSRAVNCNNYPWNVNTNIGVRCVCDYAAFKIGGSLDCQQGDYFYLIKNSPI